VKYRNVVILSPPFYSHFTPLLNLATAFRRSGANVTVACSETFEPQIREKGSEFYPLTLTRNANAGVAQHTDQAKSEADRLTAFFEATYQGPIPTLRLQAEHRQLDMLVEPRRILDEIARLADRKSPDVFLVDQLSYSATLALYCLQLPFITFCPGHPTYIPSVSQYFGVPYAWPREFDIDPQVLDELRDLARRIERQFTGIFNEFIQTFAPQLPPITNAFRLASRQTILFNYPEFDYLQDQTDDVNRIFMGYNFQPERLSSEWKTRITTFQEYYPKILIAFGTFLSARADVLERCMTTITRAYPRALCLVAGGASTETLSKLRSERVIVEAFLPQKALLPHVDLVLHHGGCNSFTEALFFGKPMIILPFSSDQFVMAHDAQHYKLAACLDPNHVHADELVDKMTMLLKETQYHESLQKWSAHVAQRGPDYAVRCVQVV
jgi:MGT family glycosyltransferase